MKRLVVLAAVVATLAGLTLSGFGDTGSSVAEANICSSDVAGDEGEAENYRSATVTTTMTPVSSADV